MIRTNTAGELRALREAHARHRLGDADLLDVMTGVALERQPTPARVLDVGAGIGNWYDSVRRLAPPDTHYVGVDLAVAMVDSLAARVAADPRARAVLGDGARLDPSLGRFDWVGLHFVLPHAQAPAGVIACAVRHTAPGGLLLAAGNGRAHLERWRRLHADVLAGLGLLASPDTALPALDLDAIAALFPAALHPEVHRVRSGFSFPTVETAMAYYGAVMWRRGLRPTEIGDAALRARILAAMAERVAGILYRDRRFEVEGDAGFVVARRPAAQGRRAACRAKAGALP